MYYAHIPDGFTKVEKSPTLSTTTGSKSFETTLRIWHSKLGLDNLPPLRYLVSGSGNYTVSCKANKYATLSEAKKYAEELATANPSITFYVSKILTESTVGKAVTKYLD